MRRELHDTVSRVLREDGHDNRYRYPSLKTPASSTRGLRGGARPALRQGESAVRDAAIKDPKLRDQALRAAKSAALNIAEAAARVSPADRARVFGISRGEAGEAAAAVEIAATVGDASAQASAQCEALADRLMALLTGLARR
jgi:four helix bundle protein